MKNYKSSSFYYPSQMLKNSQSCRTMNHEIKMRRGCASYLSQCCPWEYYLYDEEPSKPNERMGDFIASRLTYLSTCLLKKTTTTTSMTKICRQTHVCTYWIGTVLCKFVNTELLMHGLWSFDELCLSAEQQSRMCKWNIHNHIYLGHTQYSQEWSL